MKNYFSTKPKGTTLEQNKIKGKSAERYFAASLTIALNARVFWSTRTEDDSKVDLISVLSHPYLNNRVEVLFTQVKSGPSFCKIENDTLVVNKEKFKHLTHRNHHTLVCWTLVDKDQPYWFLIKANSTFFRTTYSNNHLLTPASQFDIIRILTSSMLKDGGKGLIFSRLYNDRKYDYKSFRTLRSNAKKIYNQLKECDVYNPLLGNIEFTRIGWRHITRESRLNDYKVASYEIIPILKKIISKTPTKHFTLRSEEFADIENNYRECEYILEYSEILCYDKEKQINVEVNVYLKILEFIAYKTKWRDDANSSEELQRRAVFKSIYYK